MRHGVRKSLHNFFFLSPLILYDIYSLLFFSKFYIFLHDEEKNVCLNALRHLIS